MRTKKLKRMISLILTIILIFLMIPISTVQAASTKYITKANVPVWTEPKSTGTSKKIATLPEGTIVTIVGTVKNSVGNTWGVLAVGDKNGNPYFIYTGNLNTYKTPAWKPLPNNEQKYLTNKNNVAVWSEPSSYSEKLTPIEKENTSVTIIATVNNSYGSLWGKTSDGKCIFMENLKIDNTVPKIESVNNDDVNIITINDIAKYSRNARIMYNMIIRTNYFKMPFGEYRQAYIGAIGKGSNSDEKMQTAYYKTLNSILKGEENTSDEMSGETIKFLVKEFVPCGELIVNLYDKTKMDKKYDSTFQEMQLLYIIYNNTNDENLKNAISYMYKNDYMDVIEILKNEIKLEIENKIKTKLGDEIKDYLIEEIFGKETAKTFENLMLIYKYSKGIITIIKKIVDDQKSAADRIIAFQGIREAVWIEYGKIVNTGRNNNQYFEKDLLFANKLYGISRYCVTEQNGWALYALGKDLLGNDKYFKDEKLQKEIIEINKMFSPAYYPYSYSSKLTPEEIIANCDKILIVSNETTKKDSISIIKVTTDGVSNITDDNAYLNGNINGNASGDTTSCGFYFGKSQNNMTKVCNFKASKNANYSMGCDMKTEAKITLTAGTTYYYQAYAVGKDGNTYTGEIKSFKTLGTTKVQTPPTVITTTAELISKDNALLSGSVIKDSDLKISSCGIYLGTSKYDLSLYVWGNVSDLKNIENGGASFNMSYNLDSYNKKLLPNTTYYWQFFAAVDNGTEYKGEIKTFKTLEEPVNKIISLTPLSPQNITETSVTLNVSMVSTYEVYDYSDYLYIGTSTNNMQANKIGTGYLGGLKSKTFTYDVTALSPSTTYYYYFSIRDMKTNEFYDSQIKSFTTSQAVIIPQPEPEPKETKLNIKVTTDNVSKITSTNAYLHGSISGDSIGDTTSAGFYFGMSQSNLVQIVSFPPSSKNASYGIGCDMIAEAKWALLSNWTYYYQAYAVGKDGTIYKGEIKSFTTLK